MINVELVYRAQDGRLFNTRVEAESYELQSIKDWLSRSPQIDIASILRESNDENETEWYGTERDLVMEIVHKAWARRKTICWGPLTEEEVACSE